MFKRLWWFVRGVEMGFWSAWFVSKGRSEQGDDDGGVSSLRSGAVAMVMGFEGGGGVVFSKERENVGEDGVGCVVGPGSQGRFLFITLKKKCNINNNNNISGKVG